MATPPPRVETIEVNGATELHLSGFDGGSLMLEINGVGATHARGSLEELVLELNGVGSVRYAGGPKSVERELGGLGTISALSEEGV